MDIHNGIEEWRCVVVKNKIELYLVMYKNDPCVKIHSSSWSNSRHLQVILSVSRLAHSQLWPT